MTRLAVRAIHHALALVGALTVGSAIGAVWAERYYAAQGMAGAE